MPKTVPPGSVAIPGVGEFVANAVPDPFDARDFEYRPRLQPLPASIDWRDAPGRRTVLHQQGSSCTGHAVATIVNTVLARAAGRHRGPQVSPHMLYYLARRYDEFPGEEDEGSSLRGAFKGWFHHGVALDAHWTQDPTPDLDDPAFIAKCEAYPLGAFYRVNPFRLDDVQSAISELFAIAVSGVIHEGWITPAVVERQDGEQLHVIHRPVYAKTVGGHAFALVGYNEVGLLVQNSWGTTWGKGGYATLPYEDFLDSVYDAWVARPGVPNTPFATGRSRTALATGGEMVTAPGPDLRRLKAHVVNLGNNGRLSDHGRFVSTPQQVQGAFEHMARWHDFWLQHGLTTKRHVVLYVHGGLVGEQGGLETAQKHLNWWLNNGVYPLSFVWQSGSGETLFSQLADLVGRRLPAGGIGFDLVEQFDRLVEKFARANLRWLWDEMKENARAASKPGAGADMPGGTLTVQLLADYIGRNGAENVEVHLVGHSAGSIFLAELLQRLAEQRITIKTLALLAAAIRVDEFARDILPHLGPGKTVEAFSSFAMTNRREVDDVCGQSGVDVYHKSLLYLVSRALERRLANGEDERSSAFEVPILGMERFFDRPLNGGVQTLRAAILAASGDAVFSPASTPSDARSDADEHGEFDDDRLTMTSVVMRIRGVTDPAAVREYQAHAALENADQVPIAGARPPAAPAAVPEPAPATSSTPRMRADLPSFAVGAEPGDAEEPAKPAMQTVETSPPGERPLTETAPPQTQQPEAPNQPGLTLEVADAPRTGSPILDVLQSSGYSVVDAAPATASPNGNGGAGKSRDGGGQ